jgi:hypothetical protein
MSITLDIPNKTNKWKDDKRPSTSMYKSGFVKATFKNIRKVHVHERVSGIRSLGN